MDALPLRLGHRGHRCAVWEETENTLAAFDHALACGCDGLELDLRLTADNRVVIHHDEALEASGGELLVAENRLVSLRRFHPALATLEQVLRRYRDRAWMDFELKTLAAAAPTVTLLRKYPPQRGFVVSCFEPKVLQAIAKLAPDFPRCLNLKRPCSLRRIAAAKVHWVAPHHASCTAWYVRRLSAHGWHVLVWTVNRPVRMRLLARAGAAAIVSDFPDLLVSSLPCKRRSRATSAQAMASGFGDDHRRHGYPPAD